MPYKDPDRQRRACRDWKRQHRAQMTAADRRYKRKKIQAMRTEVFTRGGGRCHLCGVVLDPSFPWEMDHVMPRANGGLDELTNLLPTCVPCNRRKGRCDGSSEGDTDFEFGANASLTAFEDDYKRLEASDGTE